jgi:hypothetical protein
MSIAFFLKKKEFLVSQAKPGETSWLRSGSADTWLKYCRTAGHTRKEGGTL